MMHKALPRKLQLEQHEHHYKPGMYSGAPEGLTVLLNLCKDIIFNEHSKMHTRDHQIMW